MTTQDSTLRQTAEAMVKSDDYARKMYGVSHDAYLSICDRLKNAERERAAYEKLAYEAERELLTSRKWGVIWFICMWVAVAFLIWGSYHV